MIVYSLYLCSMNSDPIYTNSHSCYIPIQPIVKRIVEEIQPTESLIHVDISTEVHFALHVLRDRRNTPLANHSRRLGPISPPIHHNLMRASYVIRSPLSMADVDAGFGQVLWQGICSGPVVFMH